MNYTKNRFRVCMYLAINTIELLKVLPRFILNEFKKKNFMNRNSNSLKKVSL